MFAFDWSLATIFLRTAIVYASVLLGLRLCGKREVGQMTPFDLVLLMLLANAVQNAMTGPDSSVTGGLVAAATLLVINLLLTRFVWRNRRLRKFVEGTPTLLVHNGVLLERNLERERITLDDLHEVLRERGIAGVKDVGLAVLEVDGTISILKSDELPNAHRMRHRVRFLRRRD
jgi:uncharacterized membrane protein YcaP (DUF421 family)